MLDTHVFRIIQLGSALGGVTAAAVVDSGTIGDVMRGGTTAAVVLAIAWKVVDRANRKEDQQTEVASSATSSTITELRADLKDAREKLEQAAERERLANEKLFEEKIAHATTRIELVALQRRTSDTD